MIIHLLLANHFENLSFVSSHPWKSIFHDLTSLWSQALLVSLLSSPVQFCCRTNIEHWQNDKHWQTLSSIIDYHWTHQTLTKIVHWQNDKHCHQSVTNIKQWHKVLLKSCPKLAEALSNHWKPKYVKHLLTDLRRARERKTGMREVAAMMINF